MIPSQEAIKITVASATRNSPAAVKAVTTMAAPVVAKYIFANIIPVAPAYPPGPHMGRYTETGRNIASSVHAPSRLTIAPTVRSGRSGMGRRRSSITSSATNHRRRTHAARPKASYKFAETVEPMRPQAFSA